MFIKWIVIFSFFLRIFSKLPINIQYVGRGYDIFLANPLSLGVDPGFRQNIFEIDFCGMNINLPIIVKPKGIDYKAVDTCSVIFSSTIVEDVVDLKDTFSANLKVETGVGVDLSILGVSENSINAKVSFSAGYSRMYNEINTGKKKYVVSEASCDVYEGSLQRYNSPEITNDFKTALESLPHVEIDGEGLQAYLDFYRVFGTHIVTKVKMGSSLAVVSQFASSKWREMESNTIDIGVGASLSAESDNNLGPVNLQVNAYMEGSVDLRLKLETAEGFDRARDWKQTISKGSRIPRSGEAVDWATKSKLNPVPITYSVTPIYNYAYYDSNGDFQWLIKNDIDRENFKKAEDYYIAKLEEGKEGREELPILEDFKLTCDEYSYEDRCYKFFNDYKTWFGARMECFKWGGDLVMFKSLEQEKYIRSIGPISGLSWIGLNNLDDIDIWRWGEGVVMTHNHFNPTDDKIKKDGYNCVSADFTLDTITDVNSEKYQTEWRTDRGKWHVNKCSDKKKFVCERFFDYSYKERLFEESSAIPCEAEDEIAFDNRCIKFINKRVTYYEAKEECLKWSKYGSFVNIYDKETNYEISKLISGLSWIGLNDADCDGRWVWESGKSASYFNFLPGQPTKNQFGNQDCVAMNSNGAWMDLFCDDKNTFVCERPFFIPDDPILYESSKIPCDGDNEIIFNGFCHTKIDTPMTFDEARVRCKEWSQYSDLAVIHDDSKSTLLGILIEEVNEEYWIGIKNEIPNQFGFVNGKWMDGTSYVLDEFYIPGNGENCLLEENFSVWGGTITKGGCFSTQNRNEKRKFFCERPFEQKESDANIFCDGELYIPKNENADNLGVSCVKFFGNKRMSWNHADLEECKVWDDEGGIVTIENMGKNEWLKERFDFKGTIGLKRSSNINIGKWINGMGLTYSNMETYHADYQNKLCSYMNGVTGQWKYVDCEEEILYAICEFHYI